jgi:guanidinopropionase
MTDDAILLEATYWWGIPTLFRCPYDPDPSHCDIAVAGVPHSSGNGSTERDQHLGPRVVRHVSAHNRRMHGAFRFSPWKACRINDVGDVPLPEAMDNEASVRRISAFFGQIGAAGTCAVAIGGDHSVTGAILRGLAGEGSRVAAGRKVALVHLDAHTDSYEQLEHWYGARDSAAHWAAYLVREGIVDASRSVQLGMRGNPRTLDWLKPSYDLGYEVIPMERYREIGPERTIETILDRIGDSPVYITFDLDCLDPSVAPAVSNLEAGVAGFGIDEANRILRALRGREVIGGDVVCLMPTKDQPNNITAMVAAHVAFEQLSLIADRLR